MNLKKKLDFISNYYVKWLSFKHPNLKLSYQIASLILP